MKQTQLEKQLTVWVIKWTGQIS